MGVQVVIYNKPVRDRIPEIITAAGKRCEVSVLEPSEYQRHLKMKLREELEEYEKSAALEELIDLIEVIHALAEANGVSPSELEEERLAKAQSRGAFRKRLLLASVTEEA